MKKITYALLISTWWLRPYFQVHSITILIDQPLRSALQKIDTYERFAKWVVELGEFDILYHPQPFINAQALAYFLMECTLPEEVKVEVEM